MRRLIDLFNKEQISEKKIVSYLDRCKVIAKNSPDAETKVGGVLVSRSTTSVVSEGYNGFVRGADDKSIPSTRPRKYDYIIHAEENILANAARNGVCTNDCFVVLTISPCVRCARLLYQAGIDTVYYIDRYRGTDRLEELGDLTLKYTRFNKYNKILIRPSKRLR